MSALRAHSVEITEGIGSGRELSGTPEEGRAAAETSAHLDAQGMRVVEGTAAEQSGRAQREALELESVAPHSVAPHSVSGVAERGAASVGNAIPRRSAARNQSGEQSRPSNTRAQSFHRYLSAQSDIDEEVIRLYKLVCRV
jgi:hypothetical protein